MLRAALSAPYPPGSASNSPLNFNLEVIENAPPTADQIRTILGYLPRVRDMDDPHHVAALISSHPSAPSLPDRPHSPEGLVRLAENSPLALKWPIVVDWSSGRATAGDSEGVKDILEYQRKKRDGEITPLYSISLPATVVAGYTRNGHSRCHVSSISLKSMESLFYEFLQSDGRPPHRPRCGCTLASFYLPSQQTSLPIFIYPTNVYSGSHSCSSSYGKST